MVCLDGSVWTTNKDEIFLGLVTAEITASMRLNPGEIYFDLTREFGEPACERVEAQATPEQKVVLEKLSPEQVQKLVTESGWFAAWPSGTENIYRIYAESFRGPQHLQQTLAEAQIIVSKALAGSTLHTTSTPDNSKQALRDITKESKSGK